MKEYFYEYGQNIEVSKLQAENLPKDIYAQAHAALPIPCHDVFIRHNYKGKDGILMIIRENQPVKGLLWCIGGRLQRGVPTIDSLKKKTLEECGLELENIVDMGYSRHFFESDPFGHGKGTDTPAFTFYATGKGELKLDNLHSNPTILTPKEYPKYRNALHPYMKDSLDTIFYQGLFEVGRIRKVRSNMINF